MAARVSFSVMGFEEYLERIARAGRDIDAAAGKAVAAQGDLILEGMEARAPVLTGKLKITLARTPVRQDGNFVYIEVGMPRDADADVARYGNAQEYGTSSMPAHSYIRAGFDEKKNKARALARKVLEQDGML
jgi:HK97 gp10 family phage protein